MKVVVELETYEEIEKVERFLRFLDLSLIKVHLAEKVDNIKKFMNFSENYERQCD